MRITVRLWGAAWALALATTASAQMPGLAGPNGLPFTPSWSQTFGTAVPSVANGSFQANYPYVKQCLADPANAAAFPGLPTCAGGSFSVVPAPATGGVASCNQTAGPWLDCAAGAVKPFVPVLPALPPSLALQPAPAGYATNVAVKYQFELLNPPDYTPDPGKYNGADYYELGVHEANGFQVLAGLGVFPNPLLASGPACNALACPAHPFAGGVPTGMQWTGLRCNNPLGCACRSDYSAAFCPGGKIPFGAPLYTQIWGVGQINMGGTLGVNLTPAGQNDSTQWSANNYIATWPSISIRGTRGRPVVVKWVNEFPNNHVFCAHPEAADWPCSIDRTFMGVRDVIDPALGVPNLSWHGVNQFGSPQQPDNSWVTHLHGGEIPPNTDGFAERWFGNAVTATQYTNLFVNPPFENPSFLSLKRPATNFDTYTYPMVQEEALIWFHDHTLGKTHHNVIAGPAGFFPVKDPAHHGAFVNGVCTPTDPRTPGATDCQYTWLDPLTEPRGLHGIPLYDLFLAIQDRSFNEDGGINFSNGMGQPVAIPVQGPNPGITAPAAGATSGAVTPLACFAAGTCLAQGTTPITPGVNPYVHPTWIPEYFGDHALVNGVLWPKKQVASGWYRIRVVDGSDSRCWTIGFSTTQPVAGANPKNNVNFYVIANDQGYLKQPLLAPGRAFTMCPGERYELLVNFGALPKNRDPVTGLLVPATNVWMTNTAPAPFPAGVTPQAVGSPFVDLDTIMRFDLLPNTIGVPSCAGSTAAVPYDTFNWPLNPLAVPPQTACIPDPAFQPADPYLVVQEGLLRPPANATATQIQNWVPAGGVVRMVYLNERLDGLTGFPLGMQLNGVPFEYKVTETPKKGSVEVWKFVNLTADTHPMHPHLVKHLVVSRQSFSVPNYKKALCGSTTCQPGTSPGNEMLAVPDVTFLLTDPTVVPLALQPVTSASPDGGFKDAVQAPPGKVTTIVARWEARWPAAAKPTAPGQCAPADCAATAAAFTYEDVTNGPYVWHCHINSHEDSEMMRSSLVVP